MRAAAATSAVAISTPYLLGQLAGAGGLLALLLGITDRAGQPAVIAGVGAVVVGCVLIGGMSGATRIQIVLLVLVLALGYGATALVGPEAILAAPGGVNSAAPLLALTIGGPVMMAVVSAVAFATILAVVAGLMITAAAAFAHDATPSCCAAGRPPRRRRCGSRGSRPS